MDGALRVGIVGAGPWANRIHGPGLHAHSGTRVSSVWARRTEAARALAEPHGAQVATSFDELLDSVDAVAFAVPPSVQGELAPVAARAGKHLILEKPLAGDVSAAREVAQAVRESGVAGLLMLTRRFSPELRDWLGKCAESDDWNGGAVRWLGAGLLDGDYATSPWRKEPDGALIDAGPHAIDLLDASLGRINQVQFARQNPDGLWNVIFDHEPGSTSVLTLSLHVPVRPAHVDLFLYGASGYAQLPHKRTPAHECYGRMLDELLSMIRRRRTEHPCDVRRGLHLQKVIDAVRQAAAR
ncbi:Gfo/Idh/MocA family protein [Parasphingorhabdus pacifica]